MAANCLLHPLAILNISDHYSRTTAHNGTGAHVAGGVIGSRTEDGVVEVFNSFELVVDGSGAVDTEYFLRKQAHYKNIFREYDVVGWYTAPQISTHDTNHAALVAITGDPKLVSLVLDPSIGPDSDALPFTATCPAGPMEVKVASTDAEKIGIDHIARVVPKGGSASTQLTAHLGGVNGAISKLSDGIQAICAYLEGVKSGSIPKNQAVLREAQSLCNRLHVCKTETSGQKLLQEYNDVLLVTYLASITKTDNVTNEVVEKFNTVHEKHHRHRPF